MAAAAPNNMRRLKGKLVVSKDGEDASDFDLTAAYPYGGVELGLCRAAAFVWGIRYAPIQAEEFGGVATEYMYLSQQAVLSAVLRQDTAPFCLFLTMLITMSSSCCIMCYQWSKRDQI